MDVHHLSNITKWKRKTLIHSMGFSHVILIMLPTSLDNKSM